MNEFWNRFWNSLIKMSQKEMSNIDFSDLILSCIMAGILVQLIALVYSKLSGKERNIFWERWVMLLFMVMLLMWEIAVTGRNAMEQRTIRMNFLWFGSNMDDNTANLLNVLFFLPFGILATCVQNKEKRWRRVIMTGCYSFLMSLSIEVAQYITVRGYSELVDIETNTFGGFIGAALVVFSNYYKDRRKQSMEEE